MALLASATLPVNARQAASQTEPASWLGKKKLLAIADPQEWYGHVNYHHDSASHTLATVEKLGRESGGLDHRHPYRHGIASQGQAARHERPESE